MDEQKKYDVIKWLADHPGSSKQRASLTLGSSIRHINRMLAGYRESGKAFFVRKRLIIYRLSKPRVFC